MNGICKVDKGETHGVSTSIPVVVDQRTANFLEEAVQLFTAMRSRCRSSRSDVTFRHPLPVFRVVPCSSVQCFQTRITVELFRCTQAPIAQKENPPAERSINLARSNSIICWNFSLFRRGCILRQWRNVHPCNPSTAGRAKASRGPKAILTPLT
ncbi:uncharacterized protein TNCV_3313981 [Trichonephila clavipes]|nr:uncharacterized protein TNCV_3313981 [Trichonephila clavipes]